MFHTSRTDGVAVNLSLPDALAGDSTNFPSLDVNEFCHAVEKSFGG